MGKKPSVGEKAPQSKFARDMTSYLIYVREVSEVTVRDLEAISDGHRSKTWWAEVLSGKKVLTTNDIHFIAEELMGISPYEFVSNAKSLAAGSMLPVLTFRTSNVRPLVDHAYTESPAPFQDVPLKRAAKKGTLKADK